MVAGRLSLHTLPSPLSRARFQEKHTLAFLLWLIIPLPMLPDADRIFFRISFVRLNSCRADNKC